MKKICLLLFLMLMIFSCYSNPDFIMPSFAPIDNTEDIVVIENTRPRKSVELIAIDTKKSEVVQVYRFQSSVGSYCNSRWIDSEFVYIYLSAYHVLCLNIKTGKVKQVSNEVIWSLQLYNDNLVFTDDYDHTESYIYNPHTEKTTKFNTPYAISSDVYRQNGSDYYVMYHRYHEYGKFAWFVVNQTTNTRVNLNYGNEPNTKYESFEIQNQKYLISEDLQNGGYYLHEIISMEPENLKKICLVGRCPDSIYEDDDYIYCAGAFGAVCQISKVTSEIVAEYERLPETFRGGCSVIKNGYAWIGAGLESGDFYRIDIQDKDGDGRLECKLFKNK